MHFQLLLEGHPLALSAPAEACLVMDRDRHGYLFHSRLSLASLGEADRHLVAVFIEKGRGSPGLSPPGRH